MTRPYCRGSQSIHAVAYCSAGLPSWVACLRWSARTDWPPSRTGIENHVAMQSSSNNFGSCFEAIWPNVCIDLLILMKGTGPASVTHRLDSAIHHLCWHSTRKMCTVWCIVTFLNQRSSCWSGIRQKLVVRPGLSRVERDDSGRTERLLPSI